MQGKEDTIILETRVVNAALAFEGRNAVFSSFRGLKSSDSQDIRLL
jgi:hypothetical protein